MISIVERTFLNFSADKLRQLEARIESCLDRLTVEQIWARQTENENAVGNLVLHLSGNVRQWIVSAVGGAPDHRVRDEEFAARGELDMQELKRRLQTTVAEAVAVLDQLDGAGLKQRVKIQGYDVTVLEAIYHAVEHFSMHAGQIFFATKLLTHENLDFYRHLKQAKHAQGTP
jgi:uncharacterized damage-inducible protein DinB